jgi:5-methylcytosine-specific restriction endonuclease McrA
VNQFRRDGFTDRYFGDRLIFPGTLMALSVLLGQSFPYHRNWKQSETHPAFYELYPTIDHVIPLARDGKDDESNMVTTSMLRNSAKANWLLEELGWPVDRAPVAPSWDGLLGWFMDASVAHEALRQHVAIQQWRRAAT